jgi:hypothetical protein
MSCEEEGAEEPRMCLKPLAFCRRGDGPTGGLWVWLAAIVAAAASGCFNPSPEAAVEALEAENLAAYWTVRDKRGENNYIRPMVRFQIRNGGEREVDYIQTMAVFRLESSPGESWGNAYEYSISGDPIAPGELSRVISLRSDSTFYSKDEPQKMLENEKWEQVTVDVFLRVGRSSWKLAAKMEVPRQLGAPGLDKFLEPSEP